MKNYSTCLPVFLVALFAASAFSQRTPLERIPATTEVSAIAIQPVSHAEIVNASSHDVSTLDVSNPDISTLPPGSFDPDAGAPAITLDTEREGIVRRSVKRTLEDQKELYRGPFKRENLKWDALVLGGTTGFLIGDRRIERQLSNAHYTLYQASSDIAIAGLGATLGGLWLWGIKGDHPHAKEMGSLELETLVNTFLIYTPMQFLAGRQRPGEGNGNGDFWKHRNINTSFPAGHAMFTFAMTTIVSHEYSQKWVQALAYTAAGLVTTTRFLAHDHWSSDTFVGAALGIAIGSHVFHAHCDPDLSDSCRHHVRWIF